jgi:hypothetical protein
LKVVVKSPSNPCYVITSGGGLITIPGKMKGSKANVIAVNVKFIPDGRVTSDNGSIGITSDATSGKSLAAVHLKGRFKQKNPTPMATATVTATRHHR